ncbi:MAG: hypothetical protein IMZ50_09950 [Candidatus Atribacteria bacterium]|nr:hypothetical protein [Candidatus Atribacteria bacterium]
MTVDRLLQDGWVITLQAAWVAKSSASRKAHIARIEASAKHVRSTLAPGFGKCGRTRYAHGMTADEALDQLTLAEDE